MKILLRSSILWSIWVQLFFFGPSAHTQTLEVIAHFPESGFITNRLLPFRVLGDENLRIQDVVLNDNTSCFSKVDPFVPYTFHIFCHKATILSFDLLYSVGGGAMTFRGPSIQVRESSAIGSSPGDDL